DRGLRGAGPLGTGEPGAGHPNYEPAWVGARYSGSVAVLAADPSGPRSDSPAATPACRHGVGLATTARAVAGAAGKNSSKTGKGKRSRSSMRRNSWRGLLTPLLPVRVPFGELLGQSGNPPTGLTRLRGSELLSEGRGFPAIFARIHAVDSNA